MYLFYRSPNTQSVNEYLILDKKQWSQYNVEWPEYNVVHQPYLRIGNFLLKVSFKAPCTINVALVLYCI